MLHCACWVVAMSFQTSLVRYIRVQLDHGNYVWKIYACVELCSVTHHAHSLKSAWVTEIPQENDPIFLVRTDVWHVAAVAKLWGSAAVHAVGRGWGGAITRSARTLNVCFLL